ncbi:GMC oxidoreductase [Hoeflea sp.]|uniref:GMC oxidoreductase n=1 Tax=Hoeflea sp. TaxID=1940281 RepID=UPI003B528C70
MRNHCRTSYHPVGTCRMGSDDGSVVDTEWKVHGFEGLRICDSSVIPSLIGSNTNAPTVMVAERVRDLICGKS